MGEAPAALGAGGREQKQRPAFPHAADLSSIRPERLNRLAIPIIAVRHICSFMKKLMPTRSAFLLRARRVLCHAILTDDQGAVSWSMDTGVVGLTSCRRVLSALSIAGGSLEVTRSQVVFHFHSFPLLLPAVPQRRRAPLPPAVSRACAR